MTAGRRDHADPEPLDVPDDEALLRAHVGGDPEAFAELFRRHRDRLWAVALRTLGDREDAADALQDALLSAHRAAPRFRGDSAVTTWLHRIVVNSCLDRIRRRQAHPTVPLPDGSTDPDRPSGVEPAAPATDHDTALVVRQALARLPEDQRAALVLVDLQGYPVAEAAVLLGVAEGTVKSRCSRGRARLAMLLGHLKPGPTAAGVPTPTARNRPPGGDVRSVSGGRVADNSGEGVS
ncbi:RNA polymerase sigma factor SigM [Asanoa siamensis]|uniref:RNA polymerase sigma factor SigM n=1 Tax=Asanoa siamensis TaxID=926357 RepID=A0ABQ4CIP0_9ACTN|nr:RNA polymerase sigma factor SigM [Asanoa siamensis]GIF71150.1 RNA polymerase sigma factor SigM [Asanoa siamensis]